MSILGNGLLFGIKYYAGVNAGSVAMIADAWHSLSDTLTSIVVLVGFKIASKPPDKNHPFGHGRAESIAAIMIASVLAVVGINFMYESISRLAEGEGVQYGTVAIVVFSVSVVLKEIIAQISIRSGRKINSEALIADGWHHRSDAVSTLLIVIGAFFSSIWWIDGVLGIMVSLVLFYVTYEILRESANSLMGEECSPENIDEVRKILRQTDDRIRDVHHFKLHDYGYHKEMTIDFRLPGEMSLEEAHEIATAAGIAIFEKTGINTTIHMEPLEKK